jgi:hypothetical protein
LRPAELAAVTERHFQPALMGFVFSKIHEYLCCKSSARQSESDSITFVSDIIFLIRIYWIHPPPARIPEVFSAQLLAIKVVFIAVPFVPSVRIYPNSYLSARAGIADRA